MTPPDDPQFLGVHHAGLLVHDTARALSFYRDVLGMKALARPDLPYPGAWLQAGDQQIHLMELPNPAAGVERPAHGGRDAHVALHVVGLEALVTRLTHHGIAYRRSRSGRPALFVRDPDGNAIELLESPSA